MPRLWYPQITMENENIVQPIDRLMAKIGLTNADLVNASTEQLSFKMVQKARKGRPLSLHVQEKILKALLKAKPDLKIRRRELFHYPLDESIFKKIHEAISLLGSKKINYPRFVDLLVEAGINHYAVDVAANRITFYGSAGGAHILEGQTISQVAPGVVSYEVNLRQRKIIYKGEDESYREVIPQTDVESAIPETTPAGAVEKKKPAVKKKKPGIAGKTRKARLTTRKRFFKKRK